MTKCQGGRNLNFFKMLKMLLHQLWLLISPLHKSGLLILLSEPGFIFLPCMKLFFPLSCIFDILFPDIDSDKFPSLFLSSFYFLSRILIILFTTFYSLLLTLSQNNILVYLPIIFFFLSVNTFVSFQNSFSKIFIYLRAFLSRGCTFQ